MNAMLTIKETARQTGLSADTIRYYEKIGLLPSPQRKENRHRVYTDDEVATMRLIPCLKKAGLSLDEIKPLLGMTLTGDLTGAPEVSEMMLAHRQKVVQQMESLKQIIDFIDVKLQAGTLAKQEPCTLPEQEKPGFDAKLARG
ncbi:DNA-binding transcriptional regulator, MerR family [Paenibacillus sp. UNCCL117]|uniref:MerR family transcriptional regulator n=1 Tax=unclassified Paenibacillus TaxID=185978 RepID=UPI000889113C|nr:MULTISPECIES: MerR family transcriptional regulator [unclassified Paenibacillus]SDC13878.1 DNA-binding transcriptional regulator, MerR family [Paenibacillus sp. cl123]SFW17173.1 DNA-binding transcriptional regulator, MerR family [Paenibacillus sp. UNCCL117]